MRPVLLLALLPLAACATSRAPSLLPACGDPAAPRLPPPAAAWDDGQSTFLRFRGNQRLPVPYVVQPDGSEALAGYSVAETGGGHLMTLHQTAREIRLRDGGAVACIVNRAWSPAGRNPGTGTTSPRVRRVLKGDGHG